MSNESNAFIELVRQAQAKATRAAKSESTDETFTAICRKCGQTGEHTLMAYVAGRGFYKCSHCGNVASEFGG